MYTHILLATDGSEIAQRGIEHGLSLARALGAKVTVISVSEPFPVPSRAVAAGWVPGETERKGYEASHREFAETVLAGVKEMADRMGVAATTIHLPDAHPATAIIDTARDAGCDLVMMASHGRRGLGRLLLGSQTAEVLAHSKVSVLVVR